jgi:hypothetical protein
VMLYNIMSIVVDRVEAQSGGIINCRVVVRCELIGVRVFA